MVTFPFTLFSFPFQAFALKMFLWVDRPHSAAPLPLRERGRWGSPKETDIFVEGRLVGDGRPRRRFHIQCPYGAPICQKSLYRSPHSYFIFLFEALPIRLLFGLILSRWSPRSVLFCLILLCYPTEYLKFEFVHRFCQSYWLLSNHLTLPPSFRALLWGCQVLPRGPTANG